eukprot:g4400.t1
MDSKMILDDRTKRKDSECTSCEIDQRLISRNDNRHHAACSGLEEVVCPVIGSYEKDKDIENDTEAEKVQEDGNNVASDTSATGGILSSLKEYLRASKGFATASKILPPGVLLWLHQLTSEPTFRSPYEAKIPEAASSIRRDDRQVALCMCWNPVRERIAVAFSDNTVRIYNVVGREWERPRLKHTFQRGIRQMAWRPLAPNTLAIACVQGICIWNVIGRSGTGRSAWLRFLKDESGPVLSLCWSPCGKWLASGSAGASVVRLWEPELSSAVPSSGVFDLLYLQVSSPADFVSQLAFTGLKRVRATILSWSPNGQYLVAATSTGSVLIWETWTWRSETWDLGKDHVCSSMTWSGDGSTVMLSARCMASAATSASSTSDSPSTPPRGAEPVYMLRFPRSPPQIGATLETCDVDTSIFEEAHTSRRMNVNTRVEYRQRGDLSGSWYNARIEHLDKESCDLIRSRDGCRISGARLRDVRHRLSRIQQIVLDPSAERLAISFSGDQCHRIALYAAQMGSGHRSTFTRMREDIVGPYKSDVYPVNMQFRPKMSSLTKLCPDEKSGALLCVCWSNGHISFYPLFFVPANTDSAGGY